ncbi:MAG TPA: hypothetical protein VH116_04185 [Gemmatimonadales bacterium]|nr:hypothetical protein [Gemmatimonadales bacterium]
MTTSRRYLLSVAAVAAAVAGLSLVLPAEPARAVRLALGVALIVQGPLGWWLVRTIGTERFLWAWAIGIGARLTVVAACALVVVPQLGTPLEPTLFALVAVLIAFVVIEAGVARPGREGTEVR